MRSPLLKGMIIFAGTICLATKAFPASDLTKATDTHVDEKNSVWNLGLSGLYYNLKDDSGKSNEVVGSSGMVQLGLGGLFEQTFVLLTLDIMLGPYQSVRKENVKTDFSGTGISVWTGYHLSPGSVRKDSLAFGISAGASYADLVGRSIERSAPNEGGRYLDNYVIRVSNLTVYPGIFFAWLKKPRPEGNLPELLITRIEGYILNIGVGFPVLASYRASHDNKSQSFPETNRSEPERGKLEGTSILLSVIPILGI